MWIGKRHSRDTECLFWIDRQLMMRCLIRSGIAALLLALTFLPGRMPAQSLIDAMAYLDGERHQQEIFLPYVAEPARVQHLLKQMNSVAEGQQVAEVRDLLGAPDEINAILLPGDRTDEIEGFQYLYLLERYKSEEWGVAYEERYLSFNFDLSGRLRSAYGLGVKGFHEIVREKGLGLQFSIGLHEAVRIDNLVIRLDFVLDADESQARQPSTHTAKADGPHALLTLTLPDRGDALSFAFDAAAQAGEARHYGKYLITLVDITGSDRVTLLVK